MRLTTQREFLAEDLGDLQIAGDETDLRLPGYRKSGKAPFVTMSRGTERTWGHSLNVTGMYPGSWMDGTVECQGMSLQTYPEPCVDPGTGLQIAPADYDGAIALATIEAPGAYSPTDDYYAVDAPTRDMKMLARYTEDLDLDLYDSNVSKAGNQPDARQVTKAELGNSLFSSVKPNSLYPDGCYMEKGFAPAYFDKNNADGYHGTMSFWVKTHYVRGGSVNDRGRRFIKWTGFKNPISDYQCPDQFFCLAHKGWFSSLVFTFENGRGPADSGVEHEFSVPFFFGTRQPWRLVTLGWDFLTPDSCHHTGRLVLNAGGGGLADTTSNYTANNATVAPAEAENITRADLFGEHTLTFGLRGPAQEVDVKTNMGTGPDVTIDEFAIYDFGGSTYVNGISTPADPRSRDAPLVLAAERYKEGRHYKGSSYDSLNGSPAGGQAASYFTPPFRLPAGSVLHTLHWTWHRPASLPDDYPEMELVTPDGADYLASQVSSRSTCAAGWSPDRQSWLARMPVGDPFRIHVVFRRRTEVGPDTPILESPVLDDITLFCSGSGGPRIEAWTEGE